MIRLRDLRKEKGFSLKELSTELQKNDFKISPDALAKYERGDREPKIDKWEALAKFFGVSISYLMGLTDNKNKVWSKEEIIDSAIELGLGERFLAVMKYNWDTVPMKWLLEKPELNASEEDVKDIIRLYCY